MALRFGSPLTERDDDELAVLAQQGDRQAEPVLIERYRRFARAKGRAYFLVGGDREDIEQEALIGLYKAIRDYQLEREASFRAFAELCITRQIITAIKTATRQKHQALNQYISISGVRGGDEPRERVVEELLDDHKVADPADEVVSAERLAAMRRAMAETLSALEVDVFRLYLAGKTYQEIAAQLGRDAKSVDNALQRIKRKVDLHLHAEAAADHMLAASL